MGVVLFLLLRLNRRDLLQLRDRSKRSIRVSFLVLTVLTVLVVSLVSLVSLVSFVSLPWYLSPRRGGMQARLVTGLSHHEPRGSLSAHTGLPPRLALATQGQGYSKSGRGDWRGLRLPQGPCAMRPASPNQATQ
jgi:hypothetical protein